MNINRQDYKIVVRDSRLISNGMCVTNDAFIELDAQHMRNDFLEYFRYYYDKGMIRVKVARVKPAKDSE